jgi:hypothetical protein
MSRNAISTTIPRSLVTVHRGRDSFVSGTGSETLFTRPKMQKPPVLPAPEVS